MRHNAQADAQNENAAPEGGTVIVSFVTEKGLEEILLRLAGLAATYFPKP